MQSLETSYDAKGHRYAIVVARFNQEINEKVLSHASEGLKEHGVLPEDITVAWVPGAFELPLVAKKLAATKKYDGVICIGTVIRGETSHYDYVCENAASGILQASLQAEVPVIFSVLTTENRAQAEARACPKGKNLGLKGAQSAIEMVNLLKHIG